MISPISNSDICYKFISTGKLRKKTLLINMKFIFFSTAQAEKNLWKKLAKLIGENI